MRDLINRQEAIDVVEESRRLNHHQDGKAACAHEYEHRHFLKILRDLPSAQPELSEIKRDLSDLISRQAAIDIERNATVDTNPSHFEAHQKFTQFMDDAEISSFGRWQWSNGFNTALTAVGIDLKKLPSAQPDLSGYSDRLWKAAYERGKAEADIIHCGECKHRDPEDHKCDCGHDILWQLPRDDKWYCADAERRTDA